MSNPFVVVNDFKLLKEQLRTLGNGKPLTEVFSQDARGYETLLLDFSKTFGAAWAAGDKRVIIVALPLTDVLPDSMKTQSHAFGQFVQGSCNFEVHMEGIDFSNPATSHNLFAFQMDIIHAIRGQNGVQVSLILTQETPHVAPAVNGFNGAVATNGSLIAILSPYRKA